MVKTKQKSVKKETKAQKESKVEKEMEKELEHAEEKLDEIAHLEGLDESLSEIKLKGSKPIAQIKKGDKIKVDGLVLEVDSHYVLIDHGSTKEMAIECFDPKTDKDYQFRYFSDQIERTAEFYELQEIMYIKKAAKLIEW
jgi:hypothetical protein